jgi:hypothetical protein
MVYVTEAARQHLRALGAATRLVRPNTLPRIAAQTRGQLGVFVGVRTSRDAVIYHETTPLFLMGPDIAAKLDRTVIHCRHGRCGPQLVITPLRPTRGERRPTDP